MSDAFKFRQIRLEPGQIVEIVGWAPPKIETDEAWYDKAYRRVQTLAALDPKPDTPEGRELEVLAERIEDYEKKHFKIEQPWHPENGERIKKWAKQAVVGKTQVERAMAITVLRGEALRLQTEVGRMRAQLREMRRKMEELQTPTWGGEPPEEEPTIEGLK